MPDYSPAPVAAAAGAGATSLTVRQKYTTIQLAVTAVKLNAVFPYHCLLHVVPFGTSLIYVPAPPRS